MSQYLINQAVSTRLLPMIVFIFNKSSGHSPSNLCVVLDGQKIYCCQGIPELQHN